MSYATRSLVEEIIAMLWTIATILLWLGNAPGWLIWGFGIKAAHDHCCSIAFAIINQSRQRGRKP